MTLQRALRRGSAALRRRLGLRPRLVRTSLLGRSVLITEGTLRDETDYDDAWFLACALHADVIFDVGASLGDKALLALLFTGVKEIVLIEPNPAALVIAAEKIVRNRLSSRARFVCAFASNEGGSTTRLWTVGPAAAGSMYAGHAKTAARAHQSLEVPTVTLDELIGSYALLPDLVKIDVEGAEGLVLSGATRCAANHRTRFLVEMHSNPELSMTANAAGVEKWCNELGYSIWYLAEAARLSRPEEVEHRGRCHFLLQPSDWSYPPWLTGLPQSSDPEVVLKTARP